MNTERDFDNAAEQWLRTHRYTADTQVLERIALRVRENLEQLGGYVSSSSFERAYLELVSEKAIQPFRGTVTEHAAAEVTAIPQDAVDFIEQASAVEQRKRYASDSAFRRHYDAYTTNRRSSVINLDVESYRKLPAAVVAQHYRTGREFRAGVDALIAQGKI